MTTDHVTIFGSSKIQHGKHSDRVYLMSLCTSDLGHILPYLDDLACKEGYTKIFAKIPGTAEAAFLQNGYRPEAAIPGFYRGEEHALFMGKYFAPERREERHPHLVEEALAAARSRKKLLSRLSLEPHLHCRRLKPADTEEMAALYRQVFVSYPFPIHDEDYLRRTMGENVIYFGIWDGDALIALASAEIDAYGSNAEMTDFATRPDCQGRGLASYLLARSEEAVIQFGIKTAYTIARSYSPGMNITFARHGYIYSGTLTHNTQISGALESMNVWHKALLS